MCPLIYTSINPFFHPLTIQHLASVYLSSHTYLLPIIYQSNITVIINFDGQSDGIFELPWDRNSGHVWDLEQVRGGTRHSEWQQYYPMGWDPRLNKKNTSWAQTCVALCFLTTVPHVQPAPVAMPSLSRRTTTLRTRFCHRNKKRNWDHLLPTIYYSLIFLVLYRQLFWHT